MQEPALGAVLRAEKPIERVDLLQHGANEETGLLDALLLGVLVDAPLDGLLLRLGLLPHLVRVPAESPPGCCDDPEHERDAQCPEIVWLLLHASGESDQCCARPISIHGDVLQITGSHP